MPFGIAVSTACWLFGAGPGLNDDLETSSVHWPGMTLGVCARTSDELRTMADEKASSVRVMRTIIVRSRALSIVQAQSDDGDAGEVIGSDLAAQPAPKQRNDE